MRGEVGEPNLVEATEREAAERTKLIHLRSASIYAWL
jgi:hypothetical protein